MERFFGVSQQHLCIRQSWRSAACRELGRFALTDPIQKNTGRMKTLSQVTGKQIFDRSQKKQSGENR
jgi:hypothetical protein